MCAFTAHPGESLTVHRCISHWPSMCTSTAHPCESLTGHRCNSHGIPCVLLQYIREFLTDPPCVVLQPIQVNLFCASLHFYWPSIYAITVQVHLSKYVQYKGGPVQRPLLFYFKRTS
jgi:hypothetical protein